MTREQSIKDHSFSLTSEPIPEIEVLWITAGLGCDGDTIAITAATQPSLEDILLGALPGIPKVKLHNPFLSYENGEDFLEPFYRAAENKLGHFILVIEGSIPNEQLKNEGYWAALGTDKRTGQPITTCDWIDRLVPNAWAVMAAGTCATYGGIHAMEGNPTGAMGSAGSPRVAMASKGDIPIVCVPGCPNSRTTLRSNVAPSSIPGCGSIADDRSRRSAAPDLAVCARLCMRAATAVVITSKRNSRMLTALVNALLSSGVGGRLCSAMSGNVVG